LFLEKGEIQAREEENLGTRQMKKNRVEVTMKKKLGGEKQKQRHTKRGNSFLGKGLSSRPRNA